MAAPPVSAASFDTIQSFPLSARPTCPTILIPFEKELYSLPVHDLKVSAEFHVSTAFVKVVGSWRNIAIFPSDCMFVLPLNGTVTKASIRVKDRLFETVVLPRDSAQEVQLEGARKNPKPVPAPASTSADGSGEKTVMPQQSDFESYIPNLFRLPIPNVGSGDEIQVTVHYIEPLFFQDGRYTITLPLKFGSNLLADGKSFDEVIKLDCVLNAVTDSTTYESSSHKLQFEKREGTRIHVRAINIEGKRPDAATDESLAQDPNFMQSTDFAFSYSLSSQDILCTLFKEEAKDEQRSEGTFALFVTPPSAPSSGSLARDVIFLVDRSGSMTGDPFIEATRALAVALEQLRPGDRFNIVSFDHRQEYFRKELVAPSPANVAEATEWVRSLQPERGGTDIHAPLQYSLDLLNSQNTHGAGSLPFVVLLTDGCVQNEREICQFASTHAGNVRVLTFGIGFFCNWFFLKMLAQIGRGFSDVVVYKEKIYDQMLQLLNMAAVPVLTHISVKIEGLPNIELWPDPVPDLFMGAPLTVAGRYSGAFPQSVRVQGKLPNGSSFDAVVPVVQSDVVPVGKVFLKQRIDLLTAKAWFKDSKQLQEQVVDLSCQNSMPSAYTTMVAFETDEERRRQLDEARDYGEPDGFVHVDGDGQETKLMGSGLRKSSSSPDMPSKKKWYRNPKFIAGLAIGSTAVVGAVAFSFGDVAASVANVPVIGSLADVFHGGGCCGECGCDGCGSCDCSGCDIGGCGGCSIA